VALTGFGNLAVKVADLDVALAFYQAAGAEVGARERWGGGERADLFLAGVQMTLFTRAVYEDVVDLPEECFLHLAVFTDDLDAALAGRQVRFGPVEVEGSFGRRRIAFLDAPGGFRLELMEELSGPPGEAASARATGPAPPGGPG